MANNNANPIPVLTAEQRRAALDKAMRARRERASIMQDLREGKTTIAKVIARDDEVAKRIRVYDLIRTIKGVGDRKAYKVLDDLGIAHSRRIGGLGAQQKEKLIGFVNARSN